MKKVMVFLLTTMLFLLPIMGQSEEENDIVNALGEYFVSWEPEADYPYPESCNDISKTIIPMKAMSLGLCVNMIRDALLQSDGKMLSSFVYDEENFNNFMNLAIVTDWEGEALVFDHNADVISCSSKLGKLGDEFNLKLTERNVYLAMNKYEVNNNWFTGMVSLTLLSEFVLAERLYLPENEEKYNEVYQFFMGN